MALSRPGDYITARCGRCNDITGHVVMLVLDGEIAKVECKACGSVHKYRQTKVAKPRRSEGASVRKVRAGESREKAVELGAPRPAPRPASGGGQRKSGSRPASAAKIEAAWQEAMLRHSGETPVPYAMSGSFAVQAFIEHPVFGKGEVFALAPPDKMDVLFEQGVKTLRCKA